MRPVCPGGATTRACAPLRRACTLNNILVITSVALLAGGCATSQPAYDDRSHVGVAGTDRVAVVAPPLAREDDGVLVQAPPRVRRNAEPDDPSEPFSPNYGPAAPAGAVPDREQAPPPAQAERQRQAAVIRSRQTPMSDREVRSIMAQAIIAHERRYP